MAKFTYDKVQELGVLGENSKGWIKEVNIISWNNGPEKLDIRNWRPQDNLCGKGISLTNEEAAKLFTILKEAGYGD